MSQSFPGYAEIYGGEHAGKWIDKDGRMFHLQGGSLVSCDEVAQKVDPLEEKQLVAPHLEMTAAEIEQLAHDAGEDEEEKPASEESMLSESIGESMVAPMVRDEEPEDPRVIEIMASYTPNEVRALLHEAILESNTAGLTVADGDDEASVRHNAQLLATLTE